MVKPAKVATPHTLHPSDVESTVRQLKNLRHKITELAYAVDAGLATYDQVDNLDRDLCRLILALVPREVQR